MISCNNQKHCPPQKKQSWLGKRFSCTQTTVPSTWELGADDRNWNAFDQLILVLNFKCVLSVKRRLYGFKVLTSCWNVCLPYGWMRGRITKVTVNYMDIPCLRDNLALWTQSMSVSVYVWSINSHSYLKNCYLYTYICYWMREDDDCNIEWCRYRLNFLALWTQSMSVSVYVWSINSHSYLKNCYLYTYICYWMREDDDCNIEWCRYRLNFKQSVREAFKGPSSINPSNDEGNTTKYSGRTDTNSSCKDKRTTKIVLHGPIPSKGLHEQPLRLLQ